MPTYDHKEIEPRWQKVWEEKKPYKAVPDKSRKKFYALVEFPYPSAEGLHMGHPRPYTAMDVISRKKRMEGYNVLFPMGFDSFGLPTENYAIKTGIHPAIVTQKNTERFTKQMKSIGFSFDWDRVVDTSDPDYYKWTQFMFIKFFEKGLAYKQKMPINWCTRCKIGLANEEVVNGACERCGGEIVQKEKEQWVMGITKYADRLLEDLNGLDYIDRVRTGQVNWIGKSVGAELDFELGGKKLTVFTTRPDTVFGVTCMVLAPEHPFVAEMPFTNRREIDKYVQEVKRKTQLDRTMNLAKTGVELKGIKAVNPFNGKEIPVFISDYVLMYGTGAIMAVPAHDQRDWDFAKALDVPMIPVFTGGDIAKCAHTDDGEHINSGFLDGLMKEQAVQKAIEFAQSKGFGRPQTTYHLRDWIFSRQRYWGEPIPIVNCDKCGHVPLPEDQLPLLLPDVKDFLPNDNGDSPLAKATDWVNTKCPKCGGAAKRETDVMPNWAGSSWYFLRYIDPKNDKEFASRETQDYWMNVDWYNGGMEHVVLHLLYSRFWHKVLYDCGLVFTKEPYQKRTAHGMILASDGEKMSKSRGNVLNPDDIVAAYGADALRLYQMFIGPFDQDAAWLDEGIKGCQRFVSRVYGLFDKVDKSAAMTQEDTFHLHKTILDVSQRIDMMKFNTAVSAMMSLVNYMAGLEKIPVQMYETLLKLMSPFTPHVAEELWSRLGHDTLLSVEKFPVGNKDLAASDTVNLAVQVNGKLRGTVQAAVDADQDTAVQLAKADEKVARHLEGKTVVNEIFIPGRTLNFVVK